MKNKLIVSSSPHLSGAKQSWQPSRVWQIMLDVIIALTPALIAAVIFFGASVLVNVAVCVVTCVVAEYCFVIVRKLCAKNRGNINAAFFNPLNTSVADLSAVVTGLIIALNMPATYSLIWQGIVGSVFAIVIVKMVFGGIGKNFANPAATARVFMFIAFGALMSAGAEGGVLNKFVEGNELSTATGATWLGGRNVAEINLGNMFLGVMDTAAVGEVCKLALILGGVYLVVRNVIDWKMPLVIIGSTAIFAVLFGLTKDGVAGSDIVNYMLAHVLTGGLILGAIFMATDYATRPNTLIGQIIFGAGIGFVTMLIRVFGSYPEGMSFAIVFMNLLTPVLDKLIVPKPFGLVKPANKKEAA